MTTLRNLVALVLITVSAIAQDQPRKSDSHAQDLLAAAQTDRSLGMFVAAVRSSGLAKVLREEGSLTVFALSNQAFASLHKDQLEALLKHPPALHFLLARYIVPGTVLSDDADHWTSARTLAGVKLRADLRSEGTYVNGAKLGHQPIRGSNGAVYILNTIDLALVQESLDLVRSDNR